MDEVLALGWSVAVCSRCAGGDQPDGTTLYGPWSPPSARWTYECSVCRCVIGPGVKAYTAHPSRQKCRLCKQRLPKSAFDDAEWSRLQWHGACEECREAKSATWHGDGPGSLAWYRRNGMEVVKSDRVIGRLEAVRPPRRDPFAKENKDSYWRVIYAPEPLPGRPAKRPTVLSECYGFGIQGAKTWLRHVHGRDPDDSAFTWVADYRKRWEERFSTEPPVVEWFTRAEVIERWGPDCVMCGGPFEHLDHWKPISDGGLHSLENVRPMCATDNARKGGREIASSGETKVT